MRNLLFSLIALGFPLFAMEVVEKAPIHEAFVTPIPGQPIFDTIDRNPPQPIEESLPSPRPSFATWIPGYWSWHPRQADWVWISGAWRRPPPGHQWIPGYWRNLGGGWVRIPGFWSRTAVDELELIQKSPPDPVEEIVVSPPADDYFWMPGHWEWGGKKYEWRGGSWERLEADWILTPAHYVWRPGGYIFIPAYWDWSLEDRGMLYASVITREESFEPFNALTIDKIRRNLFLRYPDYPLILHHTYYFYPSLWNEWCCTPPWWKWGSWWSMTPTNQWALFWWWSHPAYPQPPWIDESLARQITPPNHELFLLIKSTLPPATLTVRGAAPPQAILDANSGSPVLPLQSAPILDRAEKTIRRPVKLFRPHGTPPLAPQVPKPEINPYTIADDPRSIERALLPPKPRISPVQNIRQPSRRRLAPPRAPKAIPRARRQTIETPSTWPPKPTLPRDQRPKKPTRSQSVEEPRRPRTYPHRPDQPVPQQGPEFHPRFRDEQRPRARSYPRRND